MNYKIKQITRETLSIKNIGYLYRDYSWALKNGFDLKDYTNVYEGTIEGKDEYEGLDKLFYIFNMMRPADFKGHSLSVSDIVELDGVNYYCDGCGWAKL